MDEEFDAAEQLALIDRQQRQVSRAVGVDGRVLYGAWGLAWLVGLGFGALAHGDDPRVDVPAAVPGVVLAVLLIGAGVLTAVHSIHANRGISGPSTLVGMLYGWSWMLSFLGLAAVNTAVLRAFDVPGLADLLWPASSGLLVAVLYLFGAAIWRDLLQFGIGVWLLITTSVGAFLGQPALLWTMALAGGGGFLAVAAWFAVRLRAGHRA